MKQKKAHASHPVGNRTVIGIICIVVALAICFGIAPLVNRLSDGKTKIVRLTRDISVGATITEADIEVVDVGSYNLPTGVIKDKAQVVGKCALSSLSKGDYLFPSKIGNDTNNAGRMLESLDEKHKAISITIGSFALGFSGKLETGDIVGILVYDQVENRSYTPKELTYVKVITTTTSSGVDKADVEDKSQPVTVTLPEQKASSWKNGDDVTEILGVKQYEPTMDKEAAQVTPAKKNSYPKFLMRFKWFRRIFLPKKQAKGFPTFISKTDETRIQNMPYILSDKREWVATEKIDGQSGSFSLVRHKSKLPLFKDKFEYIVCSRNLRLWSKDNSSYWSVSEKYHIEEFLRSIIGNYEWVAIQGECIAPNVQKNKYKV